MLVVSCSSSIRPFVHSYLLDTDQGKVALAIEGKETYLRKGPGAFKDD